MPSYDLKCPMCDLEWEGFALIRDKDKIRCPDCLMFYGITLITIKSNPQFYEGYDEQLDAYITGPAHKRRIMEEKGISEISKFESGRLSQFVTKTKKKSVADVMLEKGIKVPDFIRS